MKRLIFCIVVCFLMSVSTKEVYAADVVFRVVPNTVPQETVTLVEVRIDPHTSALNALEGVIGFSGEGIENISSVMIETGGSALAFWPRPPLYSKEEQVIRFTGGTIGNIPSDGLLFTLRIISEQAGTISLSWIGGSAYKNDGLGTVEGISSRSLTISVAQSTSHQMSESSPDNTPPTFDFIEVAKDPDVYDGQYFVTFLGSDDISGIDRYEIVEGQIKTTVNNGVYVLRDQSRASKVVLIAYDKAGNSNSVQVITKNKWLFDYKVIAGVLLLLLIVIVAVWQKGRRR